MAQHRYSILRGKSMRWTTYIVLVERLSHWQRIQLALANCSIRHCRIGKVTVK